MDREFLDGIDSRIGRSFIAIGLAWEDPHIAPNIEPFIQLDRYILY